MQAILLTDAQRKTDAVIFPLYESVANVAHSHMNVAFCVKGRGKDGGAWKTIEPTQHP